VVVDGTDADDRITVSATGVVTVTNDLGFSNSVNLSGYSALVINGLGGDDTITINASALFANGITVIGGEPRARTDTPHSIAPSGAATVINYGAGTITGGASPVSFTGIEKINETSSGAASTLTVTGTSGPDSIAYTPTGANAGTVTENGQPTINFTGVGST